MAAPHVAGAAALVLAAQPGFTPAQVTASLTGNATPNVVHPGTGSPNRLLYTGTTPTPPPATNDFDIVLLGGTSVTTPGRSVSTTVSTTTTVGGGQMVTLSAKGLPSGVTVNFSPARLAPAARPRRYSL